MGYLRFKTNQTGEIIVNASKVLTIKLAGGNIDIIADKTLRISGSNFDEDTKNRFIDAVIEAQSAKVVVVLPKGDEVFNNLVKVPE